MTTAKNRAARRRVEVALALLALQKAEFLRLAATAAEIEAAAKKSTRKTKTTRRRVGKKR